MTIEVVESAERNRFEAVREGTLLGFAEFRHPDDLDLDYRARPGAPGGNATAP